MSARYGTWRDLPYCLLNLKRKRQFSLVTKVKEFSWPSSLRGWNKGHDMATINRTTDEKEALSLYREFQFASGICLLFLSTIGVASNSLLLVSIWKNPTKSFRSPTTNFILGLAIADLVTGLTTEPFFALYYFVSYYSSPDSDISRFEIVFKVGGTISTVTVSSSFVIVLALSCSQYVAIEFPHKYKNLVTRKRALIIVLSSWVYFICFGFLRFGDVDEELYYKVHLATHSSLVSLVLLIVLVLLYRSFQSNLAHRKVPLICNPNASKKNATNALKDKRNGARWSTKSRNPLLDATNSATGSPRNSTISDEGLDRVNSVINESSFAENTFIRANALRKSQRKITIERQLTYVTFYLAAILLVSAIPHVVLAQVFLYQQHQCWSSKQTTDFQIALLVSDIFLLLKVGLDPFVYAWRLPSYRQALRDTIQRCCRQRIVTAPQINGPSLSSNKI